MADDTGTADRVFTWWAERRERAEPLAVGSVFVSPDGPVSIVPEDDFYAGTLRHEDAVALRDALIARYPLPSPGPLDPTPMQCAFVAEFLQELVGDESMADTMTELTTGGDVSLRSVDQTYVALAAVARMLRERAKLTPPQG